jgi:hypothetical protein
MLAGAPGGLEGSTVTVWFGFRVTVRPSAVTCAVPEKTEKVDDLSGLTDTVNSAGFPPVDATFVVPLPVTMPTGAAAPLALPVAGTVPVS